MILQWSEQWAVINKFCAHSHRQWMANGIHVSETPPEQFYNLPVVLAFSILDEVLGHFAALGRFRTRPGAMLGAKMAASRDVLPWTDFIGVVAAKEKRNRLAHRGDLMSKRECLEIVELLGSQLRAFGAI